MKSYDIIKETAVHLFLELQNLQEQIDKAKLQAERIIILANQKAKTIPMPQPIKLDLREVEELTLCLIEDISGS